MIGVEGVTFELFLGYVFTPLAYMMGVDASECLTVGKLIGVKIVQNEFVGYFQLGELIAAGGGCHTLRQHTRVMALSALPLMACLPRLARQCTLLPVLYPSPPVGAPPCRRRRRAPTPVCRAQGSRNAPRPSRRTHSAALETWAPWALWSGVSLAWCPASARR